MNKIKKYYPEIIFFSIALFFSSWLMWHTFSYQKDTIYIAVKAWSDFAAHLPLIRSFSFGQNFPPEYPIFPGQPIRYHFIFYALVGNLERLGLPLDWALNIPSILAFFGLILTIYFLAKLLFKKRFISILSVIFFLFNGSLSFLEFFKNKSFSLKTLTGILQNRDFPSFGPYDGKIVSAFWNLNIYTNQRHLALAFALILLTLIIILKPIIQNQKFTYRRSILIGLFLGITPFIHSVGFVMSIIIYSTFLLLFRKYRKQFFIISSLALIIGLPQILLTQTGNLNSNFRFNPGYLITNKLTFFNFINYWFLNFGLAFLIIPLGFIKSSPLAKKVLLGFLPFFIIGNLFQFSPEIAANHKFFNIFLIVGNIFVAYVVWLIWQKRILGKITAAIIIFFLVLSGIIDFFPIRNDPSMSIVDAPKDPDITWIKENTPPKSLFLNSSYLYHPASLAGRKIFLGWPYFSWSAGYNTNQRGLIMKNIYENKNIQTTCQLLIDNKIDYFTIEDTKGNKDLPKIDINFFKTNFKPAYSNSKSDFQIYDVNYNCLIK